MKRYYNLSLYRLLAIFLVLQFHIFFICLPVDLGLWTFLSKFIQGLTALSGLLLSQKVIESVKGFYWSRLKKLFVPILTVLLIILVWNILYMFITGDYDFVGTFIGHTASNGRLMLEFGNFYYVLYILACYLITPLLKRHRYWKYGLLALVFTLESLTSLFTNPLYIATSFIIGYIIGEHSFANYVDLGFKARTWRYLMWLIILMGSISLSIYLYKEWWWTTDPLKLIAYNMSLASFGISSLFVFILSLKFINKYQSIKFFDFTDKYTYYAFLFNQAFMCGAMNVASYVSEFYQKTLIVYAFVIVFSLFAFLSITYLSKIVQKKLESANE